MRVWALLSWYDESPTALAGLVDSLDGFCDGLIALDGPYSLAPYSSHRSPNVQYSALRYACSLARIEFHVQSAGISSEVDKRARLFRRAMHWAEPMRDWFFVVDADEALGQRSNRAGARARLAASELHVAEVKFYNTENDSNGKVRPLRALFRAIPGLTVEGAHAIYTVPDFKGERLLLWQPVDRAVPALDLTEELSLYHKPGMRSKERQKLREAYYDRRSTSGIEQVPNYGSA